MDSAGEKYLIRIDLIFSEGGKDDMECRAKIAGFLWWEKEWKGIDTIHSEFKLQEFMEVDTRILSRKDKEHELTKYGRGKFYIKEGKGVRLDRPYLVTITSDYHKRDEEYFPYFFAFRLSRVRINELGDFLKFHLINTFDNDINKFKIFIIKLIEDFDFLKRNQLSIKMSLDNIPENRPSSDPQTIPILPRESAKHKSIKKSKKDNLFEAYFQDRGFDMKKVRQYLLKYIFDEKGILLSLNGNKYQRLVNFASAFYFVIETTKYKYNGEGLAKALFFELSLTKSGLDLEALKTLIKPNKIKETNPNTQILEQLKEYIN